VDICSFVYAYITRYRDTYRRCGQQISAPSSVVVPYRYVNVILHTMPDAVLVLYCHAYQGQGTGRVKET